MLKIKDSNLIALDAIDQLALHEYQKHGGVTIKYHYILRFDLHSLIVLDSENKEVGSLSGEEASYINSLVNLSNGMDLDCFIKKYCPDI